MISVFAYIGLGLLILGADVIFCMFSSWVFTDYSDEFFLLGFILNILMFSVVMTLYIMEKIG